MELKGICYAVGGAGDGPEDKGEDDEECCCHDIVWFLINEFNREE